MPTLARDFQVVAVDQRGIGLSGKPPGGYDTGALAADLVALMEHAGPRAVRHGRRRHRHAHRLRVAADHPDRVARLVLVEGRLPGVAQSPPLIGPAALNDKLWQLAFNRVADVPEQLVQGREKMRSGHTENGSVPFERARVQLAYGEHLRRNRAVSAARVQLTEALTTFLSLGAQPWVTRAENELRTSGRPRRSPDPHAASTALTPQEHEIASRAASGLTTSRSRSSSTCRPAPSPGTCTESSRSSGSPPGPPSRTR
jgi:pimeloyl-ACP methyl ester carboxylesterase